MGNQRRWDMECSCPACGNVWHTGGPGDSPSSVREAIISANGISRVRLIDSNARGAQLLKALREAYDTSLSGAKQVAETLRTSGLQGTLVDVEVVAEKLRRSGFPVEVERAQRS